MSLNESKQGGVTNSFAGTLAPANDGVYRLKDGRYARFWMGQWRLPNHDINRACVEEGLAGFSSPRFRIQDCHRWSVVDMVF